MKRSQTNARTQPHAARNYFLYTPLLPGGVTGTVELRSIVEPVRSLLEGAPSCHVIERVV